MKPTFVLFTSSFRYESAPNISHLTLDRVKTLCGRLVSNAATVEDDDRIDIEPDCRVCDRALKVINDREGARVRLLIRSLARFECATHFRAGSPPIDPAIEKIAGYNTTAVPLDVWRELISSGWMVSPAAGQHVITTIGHRMLAAAVSGTAINARAGKP